jgi:hypothetical protein
MPVWLAAGVVAAAATSSYLPTGGSGAGAAGAAAVAATLALTCCVAVAAIVARSAGRPRLASSIGVAALGAALVAARLAVAMLLASGETAATQQNTATQPDAAQPASSAPAAATAASGTYRARVAAAHLSKGRQIATLVLDGERVACQALAPADPRLVAGDQIEWSGRVQALADGDYDRYLASLGLTASCTANAVRLISHDTSPAGLDRKSVV